MSAGLWAPEPWDGRWSCGSAAPGHPGWVTHAGLLFLPPQGALGPEERLPSLLRVRQVIPGLLELEARDLLRAG